MLSKAIFLSACLLSVATSFASAGYTITYPGAGVVLNAGELVTVKWTVSGSVENKIDLRLVHGPAENLLFDSNVCSDVDPNAGKCQFTVSNKIPSGIDYALTAGKLPENFGYSSFFTIKGQGPLPENKGCPNMGGKNCPNSLPCCSSSGYCGSTEAYCGTGCVPKFSFGGICAQPGTSPKTTTAANPNPKTTAAANPNPKTTAVANPNPKTTAPATPVTTPTPSPKPSQPKQKKCGKKMCGNRSPCCNKNTCGNKCGKGCKSAYSFARKCAKPKTKRDQF